jgi:hypothetical protein
LKTHVTTNIAVAAAGTELPPEKGLSTPALWVWIKATSSRLRSWLSDRNYLRSRLSTVTFFLNSRVRQNRYFSASRHVAFPVDCARGQPTPTGRKKRPRMFRLDMVGNSGPSGCNTRWAKARGIRLYVVEAFSAVALRPTYRKTKQGDRMRPVYNALLRVSIGLFGIVWPWGLLSSRRPDAYRGIEIIAQNHSISPLRKTASWPTLPSYFGRSSCEKPMKGILPRSQGNRDLWKTSNFVQVQGRRKS